MPLVKKFKTKDEIPAGLESFYVERGGEFFLHEAIAADREELTGKVTEFRANNEKLLKEQLELKAKQQEIEAEFKKFEGIDPEKAKEDQEKAKLAEELGLKAKGDWEALVEKRVTPIKTNYEKQLSEKAAEIQKRDAELAKREALLNELLIDQEVVNAALQKGAKKTAIEDIKARAVVPLGGRITFKLVDGKAVAFKNGEQVVSPTTNLPLTISEWAEELSKSAPHLFEENRGSGASASGSGGVGSGYTQKNPFAKESRNLTEQARLLKEQPDLAKWLQAKAGV